LTPAGRAFLDHARLVLSQADAAGEAARRVANPSKPCFAMGFLTGHELKWMPEALRILRNELPNINVMISGQYSQPLADAISKGNVDAGFLRRERGVPELAFRPLVKEPIVVVLPSDHPLAARKAISPGDLVGETFVGVSRTAPLVRAVIDDYLKRSGINLKPAHETEHDDVSGIWRGDRHIASPFRTSPTPISRSSNQSPISEPGGRSSSPG
jgi:LysR family hca operon transcriptional activator